MSTFEYPYPPMLSRKEWDKKKGVIAKMAGPTGVGDQCDKLTAAYKKVDWKRLNAFDRRKELGSWNQPTFTRANWNKIVADATAEAAVNLAKVSAEAAALRDVCRKAAAEFKKSRTVPAAAAQHALAMAKAADDMSKTFSYPTMTTLINKMSAAFLAEVNKTVAMTTNGVHTAAARHTNLIATLRSNPTPAEFNEKAQKGARDLATSFGNIKKAHEKGFGPANNGANQMFAALTPWANAKSVLIPKGSSQQDVIAKINEFERVFTPALQFAQSF
jgi:hypothetical protein